MSVSPSGDTTSNNNNNNNNSTSISSSNKNNKKFHIELQGWRKQCLFLLLFLLIVIIAINLFLTLWILKVMEFSHDGMGPLKIIPGGMEVSGQSLIMGGLRASSIRTRSGQPMTIESFRNFSVNTRDGRGVLENQLFFGFDRFECLASEIKVTDPHGATLFHANGNEVVIGANTLRLEGEGGVKFTESIQAPVVSADAGQALKLESPTNSLQMSASNEIFIQSIAGNITAECLTDIKLHSLSGTINLDSASIHLPKLPRARTSYPAPVIADTSRHSKVYQLCACSTGKLFLAASYGSCSDDLVICR